MADLWKDEYITELQATNLKLVEMLREAECPDSGCVKGRIYRRVPDPTNITFGFKIRGSACDFCTNRLTLIGEVEGE